MEVSKECQGTPLISVIVPVYNVAQYLERCVESLSAQTYWNLEIIMVDDGSTDASGSLCDSFQWTDDRIRVIHQPNGGLSAARNAGIQASKGEYLTFVDSDDYVADEYVETLYRTLTRGEADMAVCGFAWVDEAGNELPHRSPLQDEVLTGEQALGKLQEDFAVYYTTAWAALYARKIFFAGNILFPVGKLCEDEFVIHRIYHLCQRVAVTREELYSYVQHDGSIMSRPSVRRLDGVEALCERYWCYKEWGLEDCAAGMDDIFHVAYFSLRFDLQPHGRQERERLRQVDMMFAKVYRDLKKRMPRREWVMLAAPSLYAAARARRKKKRDG